MVYYLLFIMNKIIICSVFFSSVGLLAQNFYDETFEDPSFDATVSNASWNDNGGTITRQTGVVNGVSARTGSAFGLVADPLNDGGVFSRLGGSQTVFGDGFTVTQDVYIDVSDPLVSNGSFGAFAFDISTAVNDMAEEYQREFIFNAASDGAGAVWITGTNQSFFAASPQNRFDNRYEVTSSGWYSYEWVLTSNGANSVIDLNLRDSDGQKLWSMQEVSPFAVSTTGGHRYLWNTFEDSTNGLPLDNTFTAPVQALTLTPGGDDSIAGTNAFGNEVHLISGAQTANSVTVGNANGGLTTLMLNQGATVSANIHVQQGGILSGVGQISGGLMTIDVGATHAPGNSPGVQTLIGDYDNAGVLEIEVAGNQAATGSFAAPVAGDFDQFIVDGDVDFIGEIVALSYEAYVLGEADELPILLATGLINYSGSLDYASLASETNKAGIRVGTYDFDGTTYNALLLVPEPSTYAMLAALLTFGVVVLRRRR